MLKEGVNFTLSMLVGQFKESFRDYVFFGVSVLCPFFFFLFFFEYIKNGNFGGFHRVAHSSTVSGSNWNLGMLVL